MVTSIFEGGQTVTKVLIASISNFSKVVSLNKQEQYNFFLCV